MIAGRFDSLDRPYVESRLIIPRLHVNQTVQFLLDTGSDSCCLHPQDAWESGIPFGQLGSTHLSQGIGGSSPYFREPAILSFSDSFLARLYVVELLIAEPSDTNNGLPSLLGRNVINRWYVEYDPANERLDIEVRHADRTVERQ